MNAGDTKASEANTLLGRMLSCPAYAVLAFAGLQCLVWTLAPALTHSAPPLDVVESYLWGREWVVGTNKHPNLPGWILEISRELTGAVGWPAYLVSQLFVAATYLIVFMLGRDMMDSRRALAGTLLLAGVFYFTWPSIEFNHNVAQMPFWAGIAWVLWRLRTRTGFGWWALLGFVAADSLYAKLSSGLLLLIGGVWIFADPVLRRQLAKPAPWLGLLVFFVFIGPLLSWLIHTHFSPLLYAAERSSGTGEGPLQFVGAQLLACLGLAGLAAAAGLIGPQTQRQVAGAQPPPRVAIAFLASMTVAPVAASALLATIAGTGLKSMWGSPMFGLAGLLMVALTSRRFGEAPLQRLAGLAVILLVALPVGYGVDTLLESRFVGKPKRQNWPQVAIATRFDALWHGKTSQPLRIVAGDRWVAGNAALKAGDMPSILTDGDLALAPWITPDRLRRQGVLVVWELRQASDPPPANLAPLLGTQATGIERFTWQLFPGAQPLLIGYAILPPA